MRLYIVRHGYPDYEKDILTLDRGIYEAMDLSEYLKDVKFDVIYASSNGRARQTAEYVAKKQNYDKEIIDCPWAMEDNGGSYFVIKDKINNKEVSQWPFWHKDYSKKFFSDDVISLGYKWYEHPNFKNNKFKEGVEIMNKWVDDFLYQLGYVHDRKNHTYTKYKDTPEVVGLFAHGAFAFSFLSSLLEIPYPIFCTRMAVLDTSGYAIVDFLDDYPTGFPILIEYNQTAHLKNSKNV